jgi:hypothetical protein
VSRAPPDAGLAELLEHLVPRTETPTSHAAPVSKNRRNGLVRLERMLATLRASQPSAFESFGGGRSRRARRTLPTAPEQGPEANGASFEPAAGGLRGLAARVSRSRPKDLDALRPAARPSDEDLAGRLDALLKDEARRLGIDLEEIER